MNRPIPTRRVPCEDDPDLFFGDDHDRYRVAAAKRLCAGCWFASPCLQWALAHELHGVWGNTSADDRKAIRRRRGVTVNQPSMLQWFPRNRRRRAS